MARDKDSFEDYSVLSDIKLSPHEREDLWQNIEHGMKSSRIPKTKRGITMINTSAAVVAALALVGGGIGYEFHHTGLNPKTGVISASHSQVREFTSQSTYSSELALIKSHGYSVFNRTTPNATVKTASGDILSAWTTVATQSQDGYNQFVFFFVNGRYIGTDTAKPSLEITSVAAAGRAIAITYPVYRKNDSFANPTGTPVTITYTWDGAKLLPNKPYPRQFQSANTSSHSLISTTSYPSVAQAAKHVAQINGAFGTGGQKVNLGHGITASATAGMGQARYEWREGNWNIEIRFYTVNQGVKQVAQNMVTYLHTHFLPAPNNRGAIVVQSTAPTTTSFQWDTTVAWQEGKNVYQLQQKGQPVQALTDVVNQTRSGTAVQHSFSQKFKRYGASSQVFLTPNLGFQVTNLGGGVNNFQYQFSKTTDGGKTWTKMSIGHYSHIEGISFIDKNTGYLLNNSPAYTVTPDLFVTHDGGATWKEQKLPIPNAYKNAYRSSDYPIFFSPAIGFIPVFGQATPQSTKSQFLYMLVTTNGGASWAAYTQNAGSGLSWSMVGQKLTVTHASQAITIGGLLGGLWTVSSPKS